MSNARRRPLWKVSSLEIKFTNSTDKCPAGDWKHFVVPLVIICIAAHIHLWGSPPLSGFRKNGFASPWPPPGKTLSCIVRSWTADSMAFIFRYQESNWRENSNGLEWIYYNYSNFTQIYSNFTQIYSNLLKFTRRAKRVMQRRQNYHTSNYIYYHVIFSVSDT